MKKVITNNNMTFIVEGHINYGPNNTMYYSVLQVKHQNGTWDDIEHAKVWHRHIVYEQEVKSKL